MLEQIDLEKVITIAKSAGDEIMKIYKKDFSVDYKEDNSPLTEYKCLQQTCRIPTPSHTQNAYVFG